MLIEFRSLAVSDLPLLHSWLVQPHVTQWWTPAPTLEQVIEEYGPCISGEDPTRCFIATADHQGIGFIQSYTPVLTHDDGWWLDEHDPNVRGIDQFLANEHQLGRGLGSAMISAFVQSIFEDSSVTRIQTDPDPANARAVRCYEKVGFRAVREMDTPDGRALLMYLDRTWWSSETRTLPSRTGKPARPETPG